MGQDDQDASARQKAREAQVRFLQRMEVCQARQRRVL